MPRIAATALTTPAGSLDQSLAALLCGAGAPAALSGRFIDQLHAVAAEALAGSRADLVIVATTKGDVEMWCDDLLAPTATGAGGPAAVAAELGRRLGAPAFAVSAACASGPLALGVAARWLLAGQAQRVVVVGGDRQGAFIRDGFAALKAIDPSGCHPFDTARAGLALGETAAAVVFDRAPGAAGDLYLQGWGAAMDANHLTGPSRDGSGLASACRQALARAGGEQPALVVAHGTGTRYNDDAESLAYAAVCPTAPVTGFKGLLGHSLGACGIAELALAAAIRRRGETPGVVGLRSQGCAGAIRVLSPGPHHIDAGPILCANAGFGGLNGVAMVGTSPPRPLAASAGLCVARVDADGAGWTRQRGSAAPERGRWREPGAAGELPRLTAREVLGRADALWGRMDVLCRTLVGLAALLMPLPEQCAVVLLSERGCAATDRRYERERRLGAADPQQFAYTLPTTAVGETSIRLGLRGTGLAMLGADDRCGREVVRGLLGEGSPAVLLARIEADQLPQLAWAELYRPE